MLVSLSCVYTDLLGLVPAILDLLWPDAPEILYNAWFLQYLPLVLMAIPMFWTDCLRDTAIYTWSGCFFILVALICCAVYFFRHAFQDGKFTETAQIVYFEGTFDSIYTAFRYFNVAIFGQSVLPGIAAEMDCPTRNRLMGMTWLGTLISGAISYVVPLIGYLLFLGGEAETYYLLYCDTTGSPEVVTGLISLVVLSITSNLFYTYLTAQVIMGFFTSVDVNEKGRDTAKRIPRVLAALTSNLLGIAANTAPLTLLLTLWEVVFISLSLMANVLPAVYYLAQFRFQILSWALIAIVILVLGLSVEGIGLYQFVGTVTELNA
jgi:amino acid permease